MIKFILGILVGIVLLLAAGFVFVTQGGLSMRTAGGPLPMERLLAHRALEASIGKSAQEQAPMAADEPTLLAGAQIYMHNGCAGCHGPLGDNNKERGRQFYPHAPHLLPPSRGVTDDPVGATHWVVQNGIRFSAMPSFAGKLSEEQLWQVSLLLANANKLPPSVQEALKPEAR